MNWDQEIEQALQKCNRMTLILSRSSMPFRKEVHREWFTFDQQNKPIHPLLVEDCELHSRLRAINYIDARSDRTRALEHLLRDLQSEATPQPPITDAERIGVYETAQVAARTLPEAQQALLDAVRDPTSCVALSIEQANELKDHKPADLTEYRLGRIAEWSLPRYRLDQRFVNLTLLMDQGENEMQRWRAEDFRFDDLRDVLKKTVDYPALVLLGKPGSGKSTLLRRLQFDDSIDRLREGPEYADRVSVFLPLNSYPKPKSKDEEPPDPREWIKTQWAERYPKLPPLESYLSEGRALLLLDALNEAPHFDATRWRAFTQRACREGNRVVFSCRSLDYSGALSSEELPIPQIRVQPMNAEQMRKFLKAYCPAYEEQIRRELKDPRQFEFYQTPYFLSLLCGQVDKTGVVPKGRAALFTSFVRQALKREIERDGRLFQKAELLSERECLKLRQSIPTGPFELPERGLLIPRHSDLAFKMQEKGLDQEGKQIRIAYDDAIDLIAHDLAEEILKAGVALNLLDEDLTEDTILFFHQLLQEYFAARRLAQSPNPALVHVEWESSKVSLALEEVLTDLPDSEPLPLLPQTGWEETTLTAAPMAKDASVFIQNLIEHNLPLAARCAASPEVKIGDELKLRIQKALIDRTQNMKADLRARIAAGEALGLIGDPRFKRRTSPDGVAYLMPPLIEIPGGTYPIGDDQSDYDFEKPAHTVELAPFQIGQFPVTNAEYAMFIEARGYEDEQWWDTPEALAWLHEGGAEGSKQGQRDFRKILQEWSEEDLRELVKQNKAASLQTERRIELRNWTDEYFEQQLEEWYPTGKIYRQPEYWDDTRFNNPSQPVVGVTWFEARSYCNWLTANLAEDRIYQLPTEAEFEAATRGKAGRAFPYGRKFDSSKCNTFESHIRRTTPVGIFDNATPEGAFDLSGNAYTWTLSIYDQNLFRYPYSSDDGRENINETGAKRVLRGGSWFHVRGNARAVSRYDRNPDNRNYFIGFRVVGVIRPPSL